MVSTTRDPRDADQGIGGGAHHAVGSAGLALDFSGNWWSRTQWRTFEVEVGAMTAVTATAARANLYRLIDQVNDESEPLTITGQRGNAVLIGEEDWQAIQETLFLASVPGLSESIRQARAEGIDAGSSELDW